MADDMAAFVFSHTIDDKMSDGSISRGAAGFHFSALHIGCLLLYRITLRRFIIAWHAVTIACASL